MTIFLASITGVTPSVEIYAGLTAAIAFVGSMYDPAATKWLGLAADDQARTLTTATRFLDAQAWSGDPTRLVGASITTLAFPRTGLLRDGIPVDSTTVPHEIVQGACLLAVAIATKPSVVTVADQGSNLASVNAGGGVGVTYFARTSVALGTATRLPFAVQMLVGRFLAMPGDGVEGGWGSAGKSCSSYASHRQFVVVEDK